MALAGLHVAVAVGFLVGQPLARYGGALLGLVWTGIPLAVLLQGRLTQNGPGAAGVVAAFGLAMLVASLAPRPPASDER